MRSERAEIDRIIAFSDAVFAVIITVLVLDLRPPEQASFSALRGLWPTAVSYAVSYLFARSSGSITVIFFVLRMRRSQTPTDLGELRALFSVSLIPFSTAWIADTHSAVRTRLALRRRLHDGERHLLLVP